MPYCISCGESAEQVNSTCDQCETRKMQTVAAEAKRAVVTEARRNGGVANNSQWAREVVVTDFRMSFGSMVAFMVKFALASIPAFAILYVIALLLGIVFSALLGRA